MLLWRIALRLQGKVLDGGSARVYLGVCARVDGPRGVGGQRCPAPPPARISRRGTMVVVLDVPLSIICCSGSNRQCIQHSRGVTEPLLPPAHMPTPLELAQGRYRAAIARRAVSSVVSAVKRAAGHRQTRGLLPTADMKNTALILHVLADCTPVPAAAYMQARGASGSRRRRQQMTSRPW